ncbi:unnamed protein product [Somion occarium]|uniref:Secreted protein n=1 Tax=Somion occarium TaxID=3059160 RepID=A0ABP1DN37_9APHY
MLALKLLGPAMVVPKLLGPAMVLKLLVAAMLKLSSDGASKSASNGGSWLLLEGQVQPAVPQVAIVPTVPLALPVSELRAVVAILDLRDLHVVRSFRLGESRPR